MPEKKKMKPIVPEQQDDPVETIKKKKREIEAIGGAARKQLVKRFAALEEERTEFKRRPEDSEEDAHAFYKDIKPRMATLEEQIAALDAETADA